MCMKYGQEVRQGAVRPQERAPDYRVVAAWSGFLLLIGAGAFIVGMAIHYEAHAKNLTLQGAQTIQRHDIDAHQSFSCRFCHPLRKPINAHYVVLTPAKITRVNNWRWEMATALQNNLTKQYAGCACTRP